jgi:antitoxin CptB
MLLFGHIIPMNSGSEPVPHLTDPRRKRLLYRALHRGTKESDAVIGGFFTRVAGSLPEDKLPEAEALLEELDLDIMDWLMGRQPVPARWQNTIFDDVMAYYRSLGG